MLVDCVWRKRDKMCGLDISSLHAYVYVPRNVGICTISRLRNSAISRPLYARQQVIYCVACRMEDILDKRYLPP